jgi:WD40 repeat protein
MASASNKWKPSGPGMTPLPPSPELRPSAPQITDIKPLPFSLSVGPSNVKKDPSTSSRLKSIAKYQAFSPQALACSDPLPNTFSGANGDTIDGRSQFGPNRRKLLSPHNLQGESSSLGAIAGAQGVAVFRISKPHVPLLMLNHASANSSVRGGRPVTALAFQPYSTTSLYLAAARGSGVLVWDASGHSLSPLLGRLAMDSIAPSGTPSDADLIATSLAWKLSAERDGPPILATTTNYSACLWDLRSPATSFKPSIRFGASRKTNSSSPYVQVACAPSNECATMDAGGTIRVFDIRMTEKTRYSMNAVAVFSAFAHTGVGISYLPLNEDRAAWVTWGLDDIDAGAVVKIWTADTDIDQDKSIQYWHMDGSPDKLADAPGYYRLVALCNPPYHLACPRVCPRPVENGIMTIGMIDDIRSKKGAEGWRADLWKVRSPTADEIDVNDGIFGMENVVSFHGGGDQDQYIGSAIGKDSSLGRLQAAELAITSYNSITLASPKNGEEHIQEVDNFVGLTLCCLSDKGYVTTHVSPFFR